MVTAERRRKAEAYTLEHAHVVRAYVYRIARPEPGQDVDDLVQEGLLACYLAKLSGCDGETFPKQSVAGAILDACRKDRRSGFAFVGDTGGRRRKAPRPVSLSQPASMDSEAPLSSMIAAADRGDASALASRREVMARALDSLNDDERRVLTHQTDDRLSLPAIARLYGREREWAVSTAEAGVAKLARAVALAGGIA